MQTKGQLFGLASDKEKSKIAYLPVPWDVTTSYGGGTSRGPQAIIDASYQIDLEDFGFGNLSKVGIELDSSSLQWIKKNDRVRKIAKGLINEYDLKGKVYSDKALIEVNTACEEVCDDVYQWSKAMIEAEKIPVVIGGDHSCALGNIKALSETGEIGILQIDAHMDLRISYQGFTHSHASIMHNVLNLDPPVKRIVQVGIRDYCLEEKQHAFDSRVVTFYDEALNGRLLHGQSWASVCNDFAEKLPERIYISFDIDGLDPKLCPSTGTPVPGGLSYSQALYIIQTLVQAGKKIIGFDLCEVTPGENSEWDANVGARVLYKLSGWAAKSQQWI